MFPMFFPLPASTLLLFISYSRSLSTWSFSIYFTTFPTKLFFLISTVAQTLFEIHSSTSNDSKNALGDCPLNFDNSRHERISARVHNVLDPNIPVHDIDDRHCHVIAELLLNSSQFCARGTMTAYFLHADNLGGATCTSAGHKINGKMLLRHGYCMVIFDV